MSRIVILDPTTLLGREVRETLERLPGPAHRLELLATDDTAVGTVTEAYGEATLVARADASSLAGADLVFACGGAEEHSRKLLAERPPGTTAILLSADASARDGRAVVLGINDASAAPGECLRSPHPGAVALAHLLFPLVPLGLESVTATVVQPVSMFGQGALEEIFEQGRAIIAMTSAPKTRWGRQLAFNLYPAPDLAPGTLPAVLEELGWPATVEVAVEVLQGTIFHGVAASVFARFPSASTVTAKDLERALTASGFVTLDTDGEERPGMPGPVEVANEQQLIVGGIRPAPGNPGLFVIWAVMDNLTLGGAKNAVEVGLRLTSLPRA